MFSAKNTLETCTRSLKATPKSDACVVAAMPQVLKLHKEEFGCQPKGGAAVAARRSGEPFTRKFLSEVLKAAAEDAGLPGACFASHSLRRGGSSAFAAAGLPGRELARWGRWTSKAYEGYVYEHADRLNRVLQAASHLIPRFERN